MFREILSIFTPKGEISGLPFILNCIIIRIAAAIVNYIGLYITFSKYNDIPVVKLLSILLLALTIFLLVILTFNYKRRILSITGNLVIAIIIATILTVVIDVVIVFLYFRPAMLLINLFLIPILLSIIPPKKCDKKDYWTTFFRRTKNFCKNPITIFVLIMLILDIALLKYSQYRNLKISKIMPTEQMEKLVINPLSVYSGKTKDEILNIRKNYVKTSIFSDEKYEPNESVFGQIADKKPWWGIDYMTCSEKNIQKNKIGQGNSEESRYINNPNLLVGVHMSKSYVKSKKIKDFCQDKALLFIPTSINYDKRNKLIIVEYNSSKSFMYRVNKRFIEFLLVGLNARDFGYNWVYVINSDNIRFLPPNVEFTMVNEKPKKFLDFIHLGNACQIEEGCNNASPYQPEMAFSFKSIPAEMTLSLWKNKPIFKNQPADIYLKMIFK